MTKPLSEALKDWCEAHVPEETAKALDEDPALLMALYRKFTACGWLESLDIFQNPNTFAEFVDIAKTVSGYSGALGNIIGVNCVCALMLTTFGTEAQKAVGKNVLKGAVLTCFSLTEPEVGSDIGNLTASATRTSDQWTLCGKKYLATGAADADYILTVARTHPDRPVNKGISLFLVPTTAPGLTVSAQPKLAASSYASCEIRLDNILLSQESIIGGQDQGWGVITFAGAVERLMVAAACAGLSRRMLAFLHEYAGSRLVGGQPLHDIQWVRHALADMAIRILAADLLIKHAVDLLNSGATPTVEICGAKVFASEMQQEIALTAMKIIGGRGYLKQYPVERWLREGLLALYAGGTNELQKNIIARHQFRK